MKKIKSKRLEWDEQVLLSKTYGQQVLRPISDKDWNLIVQDIIRKLNVKKGLNNMLDVGSGNGMVLRNIKPNFKNLYAVDYSIEMIKQAKKIDIDYNLCVNEASKLSFTENYFDRILCYSVFHYFTNLSYAYKTIFEFIRVSKPGSIILIGDVLDASFEKEIKLKSNLEYEKKISSIKRYSEWQFYDIEHLKNYFKKYVSKIEILDQPSKFKLNKYRKDIKICL